MTPHPDEISMIKQSSNATKNRKERIKRKVQNQVTTPGKKKKKKGKTNIRSQHPPSNSAHTTTLAHSPALK